MLDLGWNKKRLACFVHSYMETLQEQTKPSDKESSAPVNDPLVRSFNVPDGGWGKKLDSERLDKLSDEQLGQLYELRQELDRSLGKK